MVNINALLFDLDGVLVSTETNHYLAWEAIARELGVPFTEHDNESLKGISRADSLKKILGKGGLTISNEEFDRLMTKKNNYYLASIAEIDQSKLLPGVKELLTLAKERRIKMAVGSSSKNAKFILEKLNIQQYFDAVIDGNDVQMPKPNPEVFLKGASALNSLPRECIVFEDAQSGVEAALAGNFNVIGVGNPALKNLVTHYLNDLTEFSIDNYAQLIRN
ncbi:MAG: hypothetical protein RL037_1390 [Bacteroidota bacterium]